MRVKTINVAKMINMTNIIMVKLAIIHMRCWQMLMSKKCYFKSNKWFDRCSE